MTPLLLLIGLLAADVLANDPPTPLEQVLLQRATITVSDADRSIAFYRDVLGFSVSSDSEYDSPALRTMFHIPVDSVPRLVLLDGKPGQPRALGLVSAEGLQVDAAANRQFAPALVLTVNHLDEIHQRMLNAAVEVIQQPAELIGFSGKAVGREAMYLDPDGVRIVLFELTEN